LRTTSMIRAGCQYPNVTPRVGIPPVEDLHAHKACDAASGGLDEPDSLNPKFQFAPMSRIGKIAFQHTFVMKVCSGSALGQANPDGSCA